MYVSRKEDQKEEEDFHGPQHDCSLMDFENLTLQSYQRCQP
jgi:hypothetical protein